MPNNQAHDPRVATAIERVAQAVGLSVAAVAGQPSGGTIIQQSNFNSGSVPGDWFVSTEKGGTIDFSQGFSRGVYPITQSNAGSHVNISIPIPDGIYDLFIQFRARYPGALGGCKFCKVQGLDNDPTGYANATFNTEVSTGNMIRVLYGDGSGTINDATNVVNFSGTGHDVGRASGTASVIAPQGQVWSWDDQWHDFRIRCKFNSGTTSGNEVADGAFYVEIDGDVYMNATGLFNRNPGNGPIEKVVLYNAAQNDDNSYTIDFDDVIISTGGFV